MRSVAAATLSARFPELPRSLLGCRPYLTPCGGRGQAALSARACTAVPPRPSRVTMSAAGDGPDRAAGGAAPLAVRGIGVVVRVAAGAAPHPRRRLTPSLGQLHGH